MPRLCSTFLTLRFQNLAIHFTFYKTASKELPQLSSRLEIYPAKLQHRLERMHEVELPTLFHEPQHHLEKMTTLLSPSSEAGRRESSIGQMFLFRTTSVQFCRYTSSTKKHASTLGIFSIHILTTLSFQQFFLVPNSLLFQQPVLVL